MSDLVSLSTIVLLLKVGVGLFISADLSIFLFKLLTGRYSFLKDKGGRSIARALMPDAELVEAAFEEVRQSKTCEQRSAGTKPGAADPHGAIVVTVAADGSVKVEIPDGAFELDDAGR